MLVVEHEVPNRGRELRSLPLALGGPSLRHLVGWNTGPGRPDGIGRRPQVMGGDVSHRNRLARRQGRELRRVGHPTGRGIRLEGRLVGVTHRDLTADPGPPGLEGLSRTVVTRLTILEQGQHVVGAPQGPITGTRFDNNSMYLNRYWHDVVFDAVDRLKTAAGQCGQSLISLSLNWLMRHTQVTGVILGASRIDHLEQNLSALDDGLLPPEVLALCDQVWADLRGVTPQYNR